MKVEVKTPCPPGCTSAGCSVDHYQTREVKSGVLVERQDGEWVITEVGDFDLDQLRTAMQYLHG